MVKPIYLSSYCSITNFSTFYMYNENTFILCLYTFPTSLACIPKYFHVMFSKSNKNIY